MNAHGIAHPACEICGSTDWTIAYTGPVRDGAFGNRLPNAEVLECSGCTAQRLSESCCKEDSFYCGTDYRTLLKEPTTALGFLEKNDHHQHHLETIWPMSLRGKSIADVGCAAGSFLDHISGIAGDTVAVEPCEEYHDSLRARGHAVLPSLDKAGRFAGKMDLVTSFSVIEHVGNPRTFLGGIRNLLTGEGAVILSTPNRKDVLMDLLGDDYKSFFYRTVHRWYFDQDSLARLAGICGLAVKGMHCMHRFGLSNAMRWLRDRQPGGDARLPHLDSPLLDDFWKRYLESRGVGDYLYVVLQKA